MYVLNQYDLMIAEWILMQFKTSGFLPGSQILTSSHPHPHSLIFIFQSSLTGFGKASIILRYPQILLCIWKMLAVVWGGQKQGEKHNTKIFVITVLNEYMSLCHYSAAEWISWIESHWIECMNAFQTSRARCQGLADEKGNVMSSVTVRFRSKVLSTKHFHLCINTDMYIVFKYWQWLKCLVLYIMKWIC